MSAVFALWFAFLVAEPFVAMQECTMHGAELAMPEMGMPSMADPAGARQSAQPAQMPSHDPTHRPCGCLGDCAGAQAVGLPSGATSFELAVEIVATHDTGLTSYRYVPSWAHHVLPFENGPPRA